MSHSGRWRMYLPAAPVQYGLMIMKFSTFSQFLAPTDDCWRDTNLQQSAMRGVLRRLIPTKIVFVRGCTPNPAGRAHDASPDPLVGWGDPSPFQLRRLGPRHSHRQSSFPLQWSGRSIKHWINTHSLSHHFSCVLSSTDLYNFITLLLNTYWWEGTVEGRWNRRGKKEKGERERGEGWERQKQRTIESTVCGKKT